MVTNIFFSWSRILVIILGSLCHAFADNNTSLDKSTQELSSLIQNLQETPNSSLYNKLDKVTQFWVNRPYQLYCLGEGPEGEFDQRPLFRTDAFDCETFVDMALAVSYARDLASFHHILQSIRYSKGNVNFTSRNHFTNIDWNKNNQKQHYLKDITKSIMKNHQSIAQQNKILINKRQWYAMMKPERIFIIPGNPEIEKQKLQQLRKKSEKEGVYMSVLDYIPIEQLFDHNQHPIPELFKQIPNGAILELVTPQSNTETLIGTNLDISHLGFVFHQAGQVYFRHASFTHQKVETVLLSDYLYGLLHHKTIKGIHIEMPQEIN